MINLNSSYNGVGLSRWSRYMLLVGGACLAGTVATIVFMRKNERKKLPYGSEITNSIGDENTLKGDGNRLKDSMKAKEQGNNFFKSLMYDDAAKAFGKAIELCPEDEKMHLSVCYQNRAAAYEKMCENDNDNDLLKKILADCTVALKLNPNYIKAAIRLARTNKKLGNFKEALEDFTYAALLSSDTNPSSPLQHDIENVIAILCDDAIKKMTKPDSCIPVRMENVLLWRSCFVNDPVVNDLKTIFDKETPYHFALDAIRNHNYESVIPFLEEDIQSGQVDATESLRDFVLITKFALMKEKVDTVQAYLDKFAKLWAALEEDTRNEPLNRHYRGSYYMLCAALKYLMKSPFLIEDINRAIDVDGDNVDIYLCAYMLLSGDGQFELAINYLKQLEEKDPKHHLVHFLKAVCELKIKVCAGDFAGVMSTVVKLDEMFKSNSNIDPILYLLAGKIYLSVQSTELAKACFLQAAEKFPDYSAPLFHLAVIEAVESGENEASRRELERKIKLCLEKEEDPESLGVLARLAFHREDFDEVEKLLVKGIERAPLRRDQETLRELLVLYLQLQSHLGAFKRITNISNKTS